MSAKRVQFNIRIDSDLRKQLRKEAIDLNMDVEDYAEKILRERNK